MATDLYLPQMSFLEAMQLKVDDKIDHRDFTGQFMVATVIEKQGSNLKIHYDELVSKYDVWSDFRKQSYRFAKVGSISMRPARRFTHLEKGDYVQINPIQRHPGWTHGEITKLDDKSGQVRVRYEHNNNPYHYWAHLDDEVEIAEFGSSPRSMHDFPPLTIEILNQTAPEQRKRLIGNRLYYKVQAVEPRLAGKITGMLLDSKLDNTELLTLLSDGTALMNRINEACSLLKPSQWHQPAIPVSSQSDYHGLNSYKEEIKSPEIPWKQRFIEQQDIIAGMLTTLEGIATENNKLKKQFESVKDYAVDIDGLNIEQLDALEIRLQHKMDQIKDTRKRLYESERCCVICMDNQRNVVIRGCNHLVICDGCEAQLESKKCPQCQKSYSNVLKLQM